jgi:hypothetical protein
MTANVEDRATIDKAREMHREAKERSGGEPGAEGVIPCAQCGGEAHYHVSQSGRRLYVHCRTEGCLCWSGGLRYD